MAEERCIECGEHDIFVKKRKLCKYCYGKYQRKEYSSRITILYSCPCDIKKKEQHHPDYKFMNLTVLLCKRCHEDEHIRLRAAKFVKPYYRFPKANLRAIKGERASEANMDINKQKELVYECKKAVQPLFEALAKLQMNQIPKMILHPDGTIESIYDPEFIKIKTDTEKLAREIQQSIIDNHQG